MNINACNDIKPAIKSGHIKTDLYFVIKKSRLGFVLIAITSNGIRAIFLGDTSELLLKALYARFSGENLIEIKNENRFKTEILKIIKLIELPGQKITIKLDIQGSAFQRRVWKALQEIPPGETVSYKDIAKRIQRPKAARAVANACGANLLAVIIPCHRVIKHNGAISGYRWGIACKKNLLNRESKNLQVLEKRV